MRSSLHSASSSIMGLLAGMFSSFDGMPLTPSRARPTYPESALAEHPGANPTRNKFGSRGYTHGHFQDEDPYGRRRTRVSVVDATRFVPHIGTKERARHDGKPDGLMHTPTPGLRSNEFKRAIADDIAPVKPKRTRAKKAVA